MAQARGESGQHGLDGDLGGQRVWPLRLGVRTQDHHGKNPHVDFKKGKRLDALLELGQRVAGDNKSVWCCPGPMRPGEVFDGRGQDAEVGAPVLVWEPALPPLLPACRGLCLGRC